MTAQPKEIAASNEEAGARLTVAFDNMKLGVGDALKDTGAEFQNVFGQFIEDITPRAIEAAKGLAKALKPVIDNLDIIVATLAGLAAGAVIGAVVKGVLALKAAVIAAGGAIKLLTLAMAANPIFLGAVAVGGIVAGIVAINKAINGQADALERVKKAGAAEGATGAEKAEAISTVKSQIAEQKRIIANNQEGAGGGARAENARAGRRQAAQRELARLQGQLADITRAPKKDKEGNIFKYKPVVDEDDADSGSGKKSTLTRRVEQAQALESRMQRQLLLAQQQTQLGRFIAQQDNQRSALQEKITKLKQGEVSDELKRATASAVSLQNQQQAAELQRKVKEISEKALKPLEDGIQAIKDKAASEKRYKELLEKGIKPERAKDIINLEKLKKKAIERLDVEIEVLKAVVAQGGATQAQIDALDALIKKRKEAEGIDPEGSTEGGSYEDEKSEFEQFKEQFTSGLEDMMNVGPKLAGVALNAIGSVTDGLVDMITTGKANFREMAAAILKDIAKIMLQAAIAGAVKKMFGLASGGVIEAGRIQPYAQGGVVSRPTVFPMANGDVGLMGEAGPEAIMPLKRGPNGRLGVEVNNQGSAREAMNRYSRRSTATGGGGMSVEDEAIAAQSGGPIAIDVRYNVERINNVDYVTASEFQAGMQRAASQGAMEGERRTMRSLQHSSATRRRVRV